MEWLRKECLREGFQPIAVGAERDFNGGWALKLVIKLRSEMQGQNKLKTQGVGCKTKNCTAKLENYLYSSPYVIKTLYKRNYKSQSISPFLRWQIWDITTHDCLPKHMRWEGRGNCEKQKALQKTCSVDIHRVNTALTNSAAAFSSSRRPGHCSALCTHRGIHPDTLPLDTLPDSHYRWFLSHLFPCLGCHWHESWAL